MTLQCIKKFRLYYARWLYQLFYSNKNIKGLFYTVNSGLEKIIQWFKASKLSINIKRTKFTLFYKNSSEDDIPVKLPALMVGLTNIERNSSIKILGVMLDEHIYLIDHVKTVFYIC